MLFIVLVTLATKSDNATELDPGSNKSEEDQTLGDAFYDTRTRCSKRRKCKDI